MKWMMVFILAFAGSLASAQVNEGNEEGKSELKVLGKTWSPSFYSLAGYETDKSEMGGRLGTYNYFSFHTFLQGPWRFSLRLPFSYETAGTDRFNGQKDNPQELEMQDFILEVRNPEFVYLPWDIGLFWAGRIYTPNSKTSKQMGQIARYRNHFIFSKVFSQYFETDIEQRFNYFFQSRATYPTSFQDEYGFDVNTVASTKQMNIQHWLTFWGRITPLTGAGLNIVFEDTYWNKSTAENKSKPGERLIHAGPQVRFSLNDSVRFIFAYMDTVNRDEDLKDLGKFKSKNTEFVLHTFVSL